MTYYVGLSSRGLWGFPFLRHFHYNGWFYLILIWSVYTYITFRNSSLSWCIWDPTKPTYNAWEETYIRRLWFLFDIVSFHIDTVLVMASYLTPSLSSHMVEQCSAGGPMLILLAKFPFLCWLIYKIQDINIIFCPQSQFMIAWTLR